MFNTLESATRAMRRARKSLAHAMRQHGEAETPRAKARHLRRIRNAERNLSGAAFEFEAMALQEA